MKVSSKTYTTNTDYNATNSPSLNATWKPMAWFVLGVLLMVIFAAVIVYMIYCGFVQS
ncbi:hypothetical protein [Winogradskyella sp.]|uniref:hypothetical protein n=1 Tax=Winogradskyella sp. TaxID=1883156 RepID=UPI003517FDFA